MLVVLDDIWSIHTWESLKAAFPLNEETKSRMLLTTRNREVALHSDRNGFLHQPRPLNCDASRQLFEKIAITGRDCIRMFLSSFTTLLLILLLLFICGSINRPKSRSFHTVFFVQTRTS